MPNMPKSLIRSLESGVWRKCLHAPNSELYAPCLQNFFNGSKRLFCSVFLAFMLLIQVFIPHLQAEDSPVSSVLETAKCLVDVQSLNATAMGGKPRGFMDKATGQILVLRTVRSASYTRSGSGVIIDPQGIVVTNAHNIRGAGALEVTLFDGTRAPVREAYLVRDADLAFLAIAPPFVLSSVPLADADAAVLGSGVYSIGHSQWLKGTVLGGKLTGVQRTTVDGVNQVTALKLNFDMEKGDSGCPVLNAKGELLGIVEAGTLRQGNVTLAISSNAIAVAYKEYLRRLKNK